MTGRSGSPPRSVRTWSRSNPVASERRRSLRDAGVVERIVLDRRPVQISYALTPIGLRSAPVLAAVADRSNDRAVAARRHGAG
ncbi:winged helix-turn-helix transcriptional regulator [Nocardia sp. BMG111209]|uniref:winged helix-turn-helix transcriptional regulator n=1 Tax=Nocardia sp. BMG111209 TaxID=1160137 RepID=UPI0012DE5B41|nr:winged helix-turn-helix transcriptional regulator [Nocardia sp. BMG111209]